MKVLIFHTPKGGSGKSTLAREIAVAAAAAGVKTAWPIWTLKGPQGWYKRRQAKTPTLVTLARMSDSIAWRRRAVRRPGCPPPTTPADGLGRAEILLPQAESWGTDPIDKLAEFEPVPRLPSCR